MVPPKEPGMASSLAQLIEQIRSISLSKEECTIIRQHLLDAIASAFIGYRQSAFRSLTKLCPKVGKGSAWIGSGNKRVHPLDGAMLWAFAINSSVYEDGSREGACHPSAVVIPVIIALSDGRTWEEIDRAIVVGYEVMIRLARLGNPQLTQRGFHPTALVAPFGAAATFSSLMGYDLSKAKHALCLAAMGGAGLMASFRSGETQPLQVAWSVRNGIAAAMMAGAGHFGYPKIIEDGFFPTYLGNPIAIPLDQPPEYENAFKRCYLKPYPGCRHVHPSIDALAAILKKYSITPSRINRIQVRTYQVAVQTEIHELRTRGDAYFNIPYALAARIILGRNDWDAFDEKHFHNQEILAIMERIEVLVDSEVESHYPCERGALVEIHMADGKRLTYRIRHALGEPENPLPASATREKFQEVASDVLTEKTREQVQRLLDVSRSIDPPRLLFDALSEEKRDES